MAEPFSLSEDTWKWANGSRESQSLAQWFGSLSCGYSLLKILKFCTGRIQILYISFLELLGVTRKTRRERERCDLAAAAVSRVRVRERERESCKERRARSRSRNLAPRTSQNLCFLGRSPKAARACGLYQCSSLFLAALCALVVHRRVSRVWSPKAQVVLYPSLPRPSRSYAPPCK